MRRNDSLRNVRSSGWRWKQRTHISFGFSVLRTACNALYSSAYFWFASSSTLFCSLSSSVRTSAMALISLRSTRNLAKLMIAERLRRVRSYSGLIRSCHPKSRTPSAVINSELRNIRSLINSRAYQTPSRAVEKQCACEDVQLTECGKLSCALLVQLRELHHLQPLKRRLHHLVATHPRQDLEEPVQYIAHLAEEQWLSDAHRRPGSIRSRMLALSRTEQPGDSQEWRQNEAGHLCRIRLD